MPHQWRHESYFMGFWSRRHVAIKNLGVFSCMGKEENGCVTMCISSDDSCKKVFVILGEGQILRQLPNSLASQFTARQHNPAVL